eukprot:c19809_g1_i1 orf=327-1151(+)
MGAESFAEEIRQLIRGICSSLSLRFSHLVAYVFDPKHASSIGALAGFAIALVCTWKYLKTPSRSRKRLDKRDGPSDASPEGASTGTSTAVAPYMTNPSQRGVAIREPAVPTQLTLAQIVRRRLNGGRKMTCQLLGVIVEETVPEELQKHAVVRSAVVDVLLELAQACDLYLIARIIDDQSEENAMAALDAVGAFSVGGLNRNKVLFCSTEAGRASFVRQLEPDWHVDTSLETLSQLARFIRYELHITTIAGHTAANIFGSDTLENYFGSLGQLL